MTKVKVFVHAADADGRAIYDIIKWSVISPSFARLWLAEAAFTRVYLRVNWPLMAFSGLFGVSIFS